MPTIREIISGVYCIRNLRNGKVYVGSGISIPSRWAHHKNELAKDRHWSGHFQRAWNKYGVDAFEFQVLEIVADDSQLHVREQIWVDALRSNDPEHGYNLRSTARSNRGTRLNLTPEDRSRRKEGQKGRIFSDDTRARMSRSAKTRATAATAAHLQTLENKAKLAASRKGKPLPQWKTDRAAEVNRGRVVSAETRAKLSAVHKGKPQPLSTRLAVAESNQRRAKYHTEDERREAQRASKARYYARQAALRNRENPVSDGGV